MQFRAHLIGHFMGVGVIGCHGSGANGEHPLIPEQWQRDEGEEGGGEEGEDR